MYVNEKGQKGALFLFLVRQVTLRVRVRAHKTKRQIIFKGDFEKHISESSFTQYIKSAACH